MKVLLATGLYPPEIGGPATYAKLLEEQLPEHGIEVDVVPFSAVRFLPPILRHVLYTAILMRKARHNDILLVQDTVSTGLPAALTAILHRIPLVLRVPGDYAWEQGVQRFGVKESLDEFQNRTYGRRVELLRGIQRFVVGRTIRVIAPSRYLGSIVEGWLSKPKKVDVIYNGIEIAESLPVAREKNLIVSSGRLVPWKGFKPLIEVVAKHPDWRLEIIGDGPDREELLTLVRNLGADGRITLRGRVSHEIAREIFASASAFVLNSTYEGLSHTLVEAMSVGTPVVATRVGGNPEVVDDGESGILIDSEHTKNLEQALVKILSNDTLAATLGAGAAKRAKDFSIEKTIEATASLLRSCVSSR